MARYRVISVTRSDQFSYKPYGPVDAINADEAIERVKAPHNPADILIAFVDSPSGVAMALAPFIEEAYHNAIDALENAGESAMAAKLRAMPPIDSGAIQQTVSDVRMELNKAGAMTEELLSVLLPASCWAALATGLAMLTRSNAPVSKE